MKQDQSRSQPCPAELLARARERNGGDRGWREWKASAAAEIAELAGNAKRMKLLDLNIEGDFNAVYTFQMPVPRWPNHGQLVVGTEATFHLHYEERWRSESPPGWAPLGLFQPMDPYHPNMRPSLRGAICLGHLPPGILPREIVFLGYAAVSLQSVELDEADPEGVLNLAACEYYRNHPEYVPLTFAGPLEDQWEPGHFGTNPQEPNEVGS